MIKLGHYQELKLLHFTTSGAYLIEPDAQDESDKILLPRSEVPEGAVEGNLYTVFIYKDSEDRPTATLEKPLITLGEIKKLEVSEINNIGAFMKWGLKKELLLPYSEQTTRVRKGRKYLVALYTDKSDRLCASMKFSKHFDRSPKFSLGEIVDCYVYDVSEELGVFVIVNGRYEGLIHNNVLAQKNLQNGDITEARVSRIRPDGKLDLSQLESVKKRMDSDAQQIWDALNDHAGRIPFNDKSDPERIKEEFGMSKRAFKRAVGQLLKSGKINITDDGIEMK